MVTKLKDDFEYIKYIKVKIKREFPQWKEYDNLVFEEQINNNFEISFIGYIDGYSDSNYIISFIKDRGLLELKIYDKKGKLLTLGYLLYNGIIEYIPEQDIKWRLTLCTELIDYYIYFLKRFFKNK